LIGRLAFNANFSSISDKSWSEQIYKLISTTRLLEIKHIGVQKIGLYVEIKKD